MNGILLRIFGFERIFPYQVMQTEKFYFHRDKPSFSDFQEKIFINDHK